MYTFSTPHRGAGQTRNSQRFCSNFPNFKRSVTAVPTALQACHEIKGHLQLGDVVASTCIDFVRAALIICCVILWQLISLHLSFPVSKMEDNTYFCKVAM